MSKGRGRGRGSSMSFNIEAMGFGRGDALPLAIVQPPPDYPPLKRQPVQLLSDKDHTYQLSVQQNFEKRMRNSPYYIRKQEEKNFLERYSDKYKKTTHLDDVLGWEADWNRIPEELKLKKKVKRAKKIIPKLKTMKQKPIPDEDIKKKLEELEKQDSANPDPANKKDSDQEDEEESESDAEIEIENIEEDEDENDYMNPYFDNGESYLDQEEDALGDNDRGIY